MFFSYFNFNSSNYFYHLLINFTRIKPCCQLPIGCPALIIFSLFRSFAQIFSQSNLRARSKGSLKKENSSKKMPFNFYIQNFISQGVTNSKRRLILAFSTIHPPLVNKILFFAVLPLFLNYVIIEKSKNTSFWLIFLS